jgi:asparagine synthase (glutamine-hydrolysing)
VPTFLVSEATRKAVTVVLTGDGADEVFASYRRYWGEIYGSIWARVPTPARAAVELAARRLPEGKESWLLEGARRVRRFVTSAHADPVARQAAWMREPAPGELDALLGRPRQPYQTLEDRLEAARRLGTGCDGINRMLAADVAIVLPGDMLVKVDRMSMANALETRSPFLDQRVVEWAFALPGEMKLGRKSGQLGVEGKRILRTAFRDRLPDAVFARRKRGFEMPVRTMLLGPAARRLRAACDTRSLKRQGIFSADIVGRWCRELADGRIDTSWRLWTLLAFQEWARLNRRPEAQ